MLRIFSSNPMFPVLAACDECGSSIKVALSRDSSGQMWINGEELVKAWLDHQLIDCKPAEHSSEAA